MELEAAHIVGQVMNGTPKSFDRRGPGARDGMYDFDVGLSNGRSVALEATTAAQEDMIGTLAAFSQLHDVTFPALKYNWSLTGQHPEGSNRGPDMRGIRRQADVLLGVLETAEVLKFDERYRSVPRTTNADVQRALDQLGRLGVYAGTAMSEAPPGEAFIAVGLVGGGGSVDNDAINQSVAREVDANLAKLERSDADERHLFVWIDSSMFSEELSMHLGQVPSTGPTLPASITTVWVATWGPGTNYKANTSRLWRATLPGGWEVLQVPELPVTGPLAL